MPPWCALHADALAFMGQSFAPLQGAAPSAVGGTGVLSNQVAQQKKKEEQCTPGRDTLA